MNKTQRIHQAYKLPMLRATGFITTGLLCMLLSVSTFAAGPSAEQLAMFKNLPAVEQQRLARQMGVALPSAEGIQQAPVQVLETVKVRSVGQQSIIENNSGKVTDVLDVSEAREESKEQTGERFGDSTEKYSNKEEIKAKLKQFGYDLFAGVPTTFAPVSNVPVPTEYIIGPGDTVKVQLYGKNNASYELNVTRDGLIQFPDVGPMPVAGLTFKELKTHIQDTVSRQIIGAKVSITMGNLRSIRIFVLGEAYRPGSYTVGALSTMTNALFASGGITKMGSLRKVQLKRQGKLIGRFDLYDLLLKGDTSQDTRLLPGDVIFIPPIGRTVGVMGEVKRPAIYELSHEYSVLEAIEMAGGFLPTAYPSESRIERIEKKGIRSIVNVDLTKKEGKNRKVRDADMIQVYSVFDTVENSVLLKGHAKRPGAFAWKKGLRVSDLVPSIHSLLPNPDLSYALIKREKQPNRDIEVIKVSLKQAIQFPHQAADILLKPKDVLWVFDLSEQRTEVVGVINQQLKYQAAQGVYENTTNIRGNVYIPGEYPLHKGMTLNDLLQAGRLCKPETDRDHALLVHKDAQNGKIAVESIALTGKSLERLVLPRDELIVFSMDENRTDTLKPIVEQLQSQADKKEKLKLVSISGYVKSPGMYPLLKEMTVEKLISLAGGYQEQAFAVAAEITRLKTDKDQYQQFKRLNLDLTTKKGGLATQLISRDQLFIKRIPNWNESERVTIQGEVNFPGAYPIHKGDTVLDLIQRAGGLNEYAEPKAAIFLREDLRKREQQQLARFKQQLKRDMANIKIDKAQQVQNKTDTSALGNDLLDDLAEVRATGRLVINLPEMLASQSPERIELKNNDSLVIPARNSAITVLGEVQFSTSHLYQNKRDVFDYIDVSGGYSAKADKKHIYIIKASGEVASVKNGWFIKRNTGIAPGDTVVVPYDTYATGPMTYWLNMSQVMFQLATTTAALNSVGVF